MSRKPTPPPNKEPVYLQGAVTAVGEFMHMLNAPKNCQVMGAVYDGPSPVAGLSALEVSQAAFAAEQAILGTLADSILLLATKTNAGCQELRNQFGVDARTGHALWPALSRVDLILEELAELICSFGKNELGVRDGLVDLIYVVLGTAVTFGLPLEKDFAAVHASNMTKNPELALDRDASAKHRQKGDKGQEYQAPLFE